MKALVLTGTGINCATETAWAIREVGGTADIVHIHTLQEQPSLLHKYQCFVLPGGFSFGDQLGSGQILATQIRVNLWKHIQKFIEEHGSILGICNGFQVLCKLGIFAPTQNGHSLIALDHNSHGKFWNTWTTLECNSQSPCIWTKNMHKIELPIRHAEGKLVLHPTTNNIFPYGPEQIVLRYSTDINGSHDRIAGICDPTGRIFGLMPHPEGYIYQATHPQKASHPFNTGDGFQLFWNCVEYYR